MRLEKLVKNCTAVISLLSLLVCAGCSPVAGADSVAPVPEIAPTLARAALTPTPVFPTVQPDHSSLQPFVNPTPIPSPTPAVATSAPPTSPPPDRAGRLPLRLVIPTIHLDSPVTEVGWRVTERNHELVSEWETADYAVGFHKDSAVPGTSGNTVLSGHNNIKGQVFRNLQQVQPGNEIQVYTRDATYRYIVTQTVIIQVKGTSLEQRLQAAAWIAPTADERLTLVSCWPYVSNTHRVIVVARPANAPSLPPDAAKSGLPADSPASRVVLGQFVFKPQVLQVSRGATVEWLNQDTITHTLVSGTEDTPTGVFEAESLAPGQSFRVTLNQPGIYRYFCRLHPWMEGTIEVADTPSP